MSRLRAVWAVAAVALATLAGDSAVLADRLGEPSLPLSVAIAQQRVRETPQAAERRATQRDAAIRALFDRRAKAILGADRTAFLRDIDPEQRAYRAEQGRVFDAIQEIGFDTWSYEPQPDESYSPTSIDYGKYAGVTDLWLPVLILRYRIEDFDRLPVGRRVVYTVVERDGRWYVASDSDLDESTSSGTSVRVDPWEYGTLAVKRTRRALVLGHTGYEASLDFVGEAVDAAVDHVIEYAGRERWNNRVVIVLPASQDETQQVLENPQTFFDFAAIAKPLRTTPRVADGVRAYAGARVVINPDGFKPGSAYTTTLLQHEITHVALFERTGPQSPKWLVEGIAEYVGNAGSNLSVDALVGDVSAAFASPQSPETLPSDSDFGLIDDAGAAYGLSWTLCRYIASRYGRAALFRLYDAMGEETATLDVALRTVLRTTEDALIRDWRPFARAAIGDLDTLLAPGPAGYRKVHSNEIRLRGVAALHDLTEAAVRRLGIDRGAQSFAVVGSRDRPDAWAEQDLAVATDTRAAAAVEREFAKAYAKFDSGRAVPHGRLYQMRLTGEQGDFHVAVVVMRVGIVVAEVKVAVRSGDPSGAARQQALREYMTLTS